LLKIALIILVIVCFAVLLGLLYMSFKMLRKTQKEEALENRHLKKEYELHPKLKEQQKK
jgi:flagellar basal body-associated protein FliL